MVERFQPEVRLTPRRTCCWSECDAGATAKASSKLLAEHGVSAEQPFQPHAASLDGVPGPADLRAGAGGIGASDCPRMLTRIEGLLAELGLQDEEIIVRMTGCPNGCARPYMAEIGFRRQSAQQIPDLPRRQRRQHTAESALQGLRKRART